MLKLLATGMSQVDIANALNIGTSRVSNLVGELKQDKFISKIGQNWKPTEKGELYLNNNN